MSKRHVCKMLRDMATGEPVKVTSARASIRELARLACIAEQFGHTYADARQGGGPQGKGMVMALVPDTARVAQERAALNRARYPHAGDGVSLPPIDPDAVEFLRIRIIVDAPTRYDDRQRAVIAVVSFTLWGAIPRSPPPRRPPAPPHRGRLLGGGDGPCRFPDRGRPSQAGPVRHPAAGPR
jgi:hypothetical protein